MNYKQIKAIEQKNKERILAVNHTVPDLSGIYILTRREDGFNYAYIGQAVKILTRLAGHLNGYQHIDLSLKKHGFYSTTNPTGWEIDYRLYNAADLDFWEQHYIKEYANKGYQLRNKTSGSQGEGKRGIAENKPSKGYYDGVAQGYKNAQKEVAHIFDLYLDYTPKCKLTKNAEKAIKKWQTFIGIDKEIENGTTENVGNS